MVLSRDRLNFGSYDNPEQLKNFKPFFSLFDKKIRFQSYDGKWYDNDSYLINYRFLEEKGKDEILDTLFEKWNNTTD